VYELTVSDGALDISDLLLLVKEGGQQNSRSSEQNTEIVSRKSILKLSVTYAKEMLKPQIALVSKQLDLLSPLQSSSESMVPGLLRLAIKAYRMSPFLVMGKW